MREREGDDGVIIHTHATALSAPMLKAALPAAAARSAASRWPNATRAGRARRAEHERANAAVFLGRDLVLSLRGCARQLARHGGRAAARRSARASPSHRTSVTCSRKAPPRMQARHALRQNGGSLDAERNALARSGLAGASAFSTSCQARSAPRRPFLNEFAADGDVSGLAAQSELTRTQLFAARVSMRSRRAAVHGDALDAACGV